MDIGQRYIDHGVVDATQLREAVLACPEALWDADDGLKEHLAKNRSTQSLFLLRVDSRGIYETLSQRPLKQSDIAKHSSWLLLQAHAAPLLKKISEIYTNNGIFVSVQIARLPAGGKIQEHIDKSQLLVNSHRLHIPLVTNDEVNFVIDGKRVILEPDRLYEINNTLLHSVENHSDKSRLHFIIDYLPAERNSKQFFCGPGVKEKLTRITKRFEKKGLSKVLATSVVRGAHQAESHGGIYLVDLQTSEVEQKFDWNRGDIDFQGRGWDRGLRGIAYHGDDIYIAASDELFLFDQNFEIKDSFKNPYLKHAHEICVHKDKLFLTSTGFDSILRFDLTKKAFDYAVSVRRTNEGQISVDSYDPNGDGGPEFKNTLHINQVCVIEDGLFLSGRKLPFLMRLAGGDVSKVCPLPAGSHNAQPYRGGVLVNDTESDRVVFFDKLQFTEMRVPSFSNDELVNAQYSDTRVARQSFGRGLCVSDGIVYAGSSPSTISAYDLKSKVRFKSVNISMDVRNAVHGLAVWPY